MPSKLQHEIDKQIQEINTIIVNNIIRDQEISTISTQIKNNLSIINSNYRHIATNKALANSKLKKEGSEDLKIYRDGSNLQLSLDADAASNALALSIYGGVVAQNYLTVGQDTLSTSSTLYVIGSARISTTLTAINSVKTGYIQNPYSNAANMVMNIGVSGTDSTNHQVNLRIDDNNIIVAQATGNGSGGITNKAVGLYGTTPTTQAAHIADPAESIAANNTAIDAILVALRSIGLIASS